jgi:ATP-dependent Lon protease
MAIQTEPKPEQEIRIPDVLPVLPLQDGTIVYPLAVVLLAIGHANVVQLIDDTMVRDQLIAAVAQRRDDVTTPAPDDLYRIGTVAIIHQLARAGDRTLRILVQGLQRIRMVDIVQTNPYLVARLESRARTLCGWSRECGPAAFGPRSLQARRQSHRAGGRIGCLG